jgi:hypothetical protein
MAVANLAYLLALAAAWIISCIAGRRRARP